MPDSDSCLADTTTIDLSIANNALGGDFQLSEKAGNGLSILPDGLYLKSPRYDVSRRVAASAVVLGVATTANLLALATSVIADPPTMTFSTSRIQIQRTGMYLVTGEVAFNSFVTGTFRAASIGINVGGRENGYPDVIWRNNAVAFTTHDQQANYSGLHYLERGVFIGLYAQTDAANAASATVLLEDGGVVLTAACIVDLSV